MCKKYIMAFFVLCVPSSSKAVLVGLEHFIGDDSTFRAGNIYLLPEFHRAPQKVDDIQVCALRDVLRLREQKSAVPLHIYVEVPSLLAQQTNGKGIVTTELPDLACEHKLCKVEDIEMRCASIAAVWTLRLPVEYFQYRAALEKTMFNAGKDACCVVGQVTIDDVKREFIVHARASMTNIGAKPMLQDVCSQKFKFLSQLIHKFHEAIESLGLNGRDKILDISSKLAVSHDGLERRKAFALVIEDMFIGLFDVHILTKIISQEEGDVAVVAGYEHLDWISRTITQCGLKMMPGVKGQLVREHFNVLA